MRVEVSGQAPSQLDETSLVLDVTPTTHHLPPQGDGAELVCASFEFGAGLHNPLVMAMPQMVLMCTNADPTPPAFQTAYHLRFR
jgi:hypothetical protein